MAEKKSKLAVIITKPTSASVEDFINAVPDEQKRKDSFTLMEMMKRRPEKNRCSGAVRSSVSAINGIKSPNTGPEVDWLRNGFSPRKANLSLYLSINIKKHAAALKKLGKHKTGVGCLYINTLDDIDLKVLKSMIVTSLKKK